MPFIKARETELAWQAVLEDDEAFEVTSSWKEDCNKIIPLGQKKLGDQRRLATKYGNFVKLRFPDFVGKEWAVEGLRGKYLSLNHIISHFHASFRQNKDIFGRAHSPL